MSIFNINCIQAIVKHFVKLFTFGSLKLKHLSENCPRFVSNISWMCCANGAAIKNLDCFRATLFCGEQGENFCWSNNQSCKWVRWTPKLSENKWQIFTSVSNILTTVMSKSEYFHNNALYVQGLQYGGREPFHCVMQVIYFIHRISFIFSY